MMLERIKRLFGRRPRAEKWNAQYASGQWDYLGRLDELAHYSVLAGYALHLRPGGRLLDVGCGEGLLRDRLPARAFGEYVGVDFAEPIARAAGRADERTTFEAADMETYAPPRAFDVIVFNEVLYYFSDPMSAAARYAAHLAPQGVLLVSMFAKPRVVELWHALEHHFAVIDRVSVTNGQGSTWLCGAIAPRSASP